jgi:hypothetical protein
MTNPALHAKVDNAVATVESFSALLDQETTALKAADFTTFEKLQEEKILQAQAYQDAVLSFEEDLDSLKAMDEALKAKLRATHMRYHMATSANLRALQNAQNTAERLVKLIMDAAKRSVAVEAPSYGRTGHQALSEKIPVSFKLNEAV